MLIKNPHHKKKNLFNGLKKDLSLRCCPLMLCPEKAQDAEHVMLLSSAVEECSTAHLPSLQPNHCSKLKLPTIVRQGGTRL
jgi:hypothetical protein